MSNRLTTLVVVGAAIAGAVAPASLTGHVVIDTVERAIFAGLVAYITAHGHRWSWFVGAAFILLPARGPSLVLVALASLAATWAATRPSRPKHVGALVGGLLANACLWYTDQAFAPPVIAACALVGTGILTVSGYRAMKPAPRRSVTPLLLAALAVVVLGLGGAIVGALLSASDLTAGTADARKALSAVENGDTESARLSLESARQHLDRADGVLGPATLAARLVPSLAQHVTALDIALGESRNITKAADGLLASADYDRLRYRGRIDIAQLRALSPGASEVNEVLTRAEGRLTDAGAPWLVGPVRDRLDDLHSEVTEVQEASELASHVLEVAPALFGGDGDRRYLVVFMTPAELRGGGGFIGSYAELLASDGRFSLAESGPIRELIYHGDFGDRTLNGPAEYLERYGRFQTVDYIQDVTLSPHFPYNAEVLAQLYPQSGGSPVDGVIGVDPIGLAALLELTGPVQVEGRDEPLTAENAADFLTRDQYLEFLDGVDGSWETYDRLNEERRDFLAAATTATFEELTRASLPAPAEIGAALGPAARGRHIQVWSRRGAEQELLERVDADSALDIPDGFDGFELVQQNAGNDKLDAYLQRTIEYTAEIDPSSGRLTGTVRATLENNVPSDIPPRIAGRRVDVPGTSRTWLTLFTHHGIVSASLDGRPMSVGWEEEVGLNAYDTPFIEIPPGESVTLEFVLDGWVDLSDGYELRIFPQPVANPDVVELDVSLTDGRFGGPDSADGTVVYSGPMVEPITAEAQVLKG